RIRIPADVPSASGPHHEACAPPARVDAARPHRTGALLRQRRPRPAATGLTAVASPPLPTRRTIPMQAAHLGCAADSATRPAPFPALACAGPRQTAAARSTPG